MPENTKQAESPPTAEAQHDAAQASKAKATTKPSDELSEADLKAVAGGAWSKARS
jgi:hypothetical protein